MWSSYSAAAAATAAMLGQQQQHGSQLLLSTPPPLLLPPQLLSTLVEAAEGSADMQPRPKRSKHQVATGLQFLEDALKHSASAIYGYHKIWGPPKPAATPWLEAAALEALRSTYGMSSPTTGNPNDKEIDDARRQAEAATRSHGSRAVQQQQHARPWVSMSGAPRDYDVDAATLAAATAAAAADFRFGAASSYAPAIFQNSHAQMKHSPIRVQPQKGGAHDLGAASIAGYSGAGFSGSPAPRFSSSAVSSPVRTAGECRSMTIQPAAKEQDGKPRRNSHTGPAPPSALQEGAELLPLPSDNIMPIDLSEKATGQDQRRYRVASPADGFHRAASGRPFASSSLADDCRGAAASAKGYLASEQGGTAGQAVGARRGVGAGRGFGRGTGSVGGAGAGQGAGAGRDARRGRAAGSDRDAEPGQFTANGAVAAVYTASVPRDHNGARRAAARRPKATDAIGPVVEAAGRGRGRGRAKLPRASEINPRWLLPFKHGWRRLVVFRNLPTQEGALSAQGRGGRGRGSADTGHGRRPGRMRNPAPTMADAYYYPPSSNKKLRSQPQVTAYLAKHPTEGLGGDCFTFLRRPLFGPPHEMVRQAGRSACRGKRRPAAFQPAATSEAPAATAAAADEAAGAAAVGHSSNTPPVMDADGAEANTTVVWVAVTAAAEATGGAAAPRPTESKPEVSTAVAGKIAGGDADRCKAASSPTKQTGSTSTIQDGVDGPEIAAAPVRQLQAGSSGAPLTVAKQRGCSTSRDMEAEMEEVDREPLNARAPATKAVQPCSEDCRHDARPSESVDDISTPIQNLLKVHDSNGSSAPPGSSSGTRKKFRASAEARSRALAYLAEASQPAACDPSDGQGRLLSSARSGATAQSSKREPPASSGPASSKPASSGPASSKPASSKPASSKPASSGPASSKPASSRPETAADTRPQQHQPPTEARSTSIVPDELRARVIRQGGEALILSPGHFSRHSRDHPLQIDVHHLPDSNASNSGVRSSGAGSSGAGSSGVGSRGAGSSGSNRGVGSSGSSRGVGSSGAGSSGNSRRVSSRRAGSSGAGSSGAGSSGAGSSGAGSSGAGSGGSTGHCCSQRCGAAVKCPAHPEGHGSAAASTTGQVVIPTSVLRQISHKFPIIMFFRDGQAIIEQEVEGLALAVLPIYRVDGDAHCYDSAAPLPLAVSRVMAGEFGNVQAADVVGESCLLRIMAHLPTKSLLSAASVCRRWRNISRASALWERLCLRGLRITDWTAALTFARERGVKHIIFDCKLSNLFSGPITHVLPMPSAAEAAVGPVALAYLVHSTFPCELPTALPAVQDEEGPSHHA